MLKYACTQKDCRRTQKKNRIKSNGGVCEHAAHTLPTISKTYRCCENNLHVERFKYRRKRRNYFRSVGMHMVEDKHIKRKIVGMMMTVERIGRMNDGMQ